MGMQLESGKGKSLRPNINVTPLVDVVLVLLIIFMVVIPNMQEHKTIQLFKTTHGEKDADEEKEALVVTMAFDGTYHVGESQLSRDAALAELKRVKADEPGRRVMLRGDQRLAYGQIRKFLYDVKELGHDRVKLAVGAIQEADLSRGGLAGE